jgi:hypothetical protein
MHIPLDPSESRHEVSVGIEEGGKDGQPAGIRCEFVENEAMAAEYREKRVGNEARIPIEKSIDDIVVLCREQ